MKLISWEKRFKMSVFPLVYVILLVEGVVGDVDYRSEQKYGLSPDTLRYYERIGLIPPVHRTAGGVRDYTENDCNWVEFIKCIVEQVFRWKH